MSKPTSVSAENKAISRHVAQAFGGTPHVRIYDHDTIDLSVAILSSANRPVKGVTSYATVGLSDYPMRYAKGEFPTRLELVGGCEALRVEFANILSAAAFCVMRTGMLIAPGSVMRNYVGEFVADSSVPHLYFSPPFLWESVLKSRDFGPKTVSWLLAIPISEAEARYCDEHGGSALEDLFEKHQIDIYNLYRSSVT
jgi:hypothetical protein